MIFKSKIINHNDSQILLKVKNTLVIHVVFTVIALDEFSFFSSIRQLPIIMTIIRMSLR